MTTDRISMTELRPKLDHLAPDEIIVDVRTPDEYRAGHLPGSRNIPHDHLGSHVEELREYRHVFVHCRSGKRAAMATEILQRAGLTNVVCVGNSGMDDWLAAGLPVER